MVKSLSKRELAERLVSMEDRLDCMETTLAAVAGEIDGVSLSSRCSKCEQSMLIIKDGMLYCPHCGHGNSL
jgi:hypothetical protein